MLDNDEPSVCHLLHSPDEKVLGGAQAVRAPNYGLTRLMQSTNLCLSEQESGNAIVTFAVSLAVS